MARYIISYDLRKPNYTEADYKKMYAALDTYNVKPVQDSVWACRSASTSKEIFDDIWQHMHQAKGRVLSRNSPVSFAPSTRLPNSRMSDSFFVRFIPDSLVKQVQQNVGRGLAVTKENTPSVPVTVGC